MQAVEDPPTLIAALEYASRGWAVFPCHSVVSLSPDTCSCKAGERCESMGKHPRTERGLNDATTDAGQIRAWWARWPTANVAIRTGGGLFVLDVDPRHDGTTVGLDLPDTLRALTPRGGEHWYLTTAEPIPSSVNMVGPGLDVRAEGGYVVAPPSSGVGGRAYAWDVGSADAVAPVPDWLAIRSNRQRVKPQASGAEPDAFLSGARNTSLTALAGSMVRRGFGHDAVEAALLSENARRCRPMLDEREVVRIASSVSRYEPSAPVVASSGWRLRNAVEISRPLPPVPWLCERLELAPGAVSMFAGFGYSGKTASAQSLALSIASGKLVWGAYPCRAGRVLHLDYEQGRRLTDERYQRLALGMGLTLSDLADSLCVSSFPDLYLDSPGCWSTLEDLVRDFDLVMVDSFRAAFPGIDENASDVRKWLDPFGRLSETTGTSFLLIHHARKSSKADNGGSIQTLRGSSAILDACQSVLVFNGQKGEPPKVEHVKARITGRALPDFQLDISDVSGPSSDPELDGRDDPRAGLAIRVGGAAPLSPLEAIRAALLDAVRTMPGQSRNMILASAKAGNRTQRWEVLEQLIEAGAVLTEQRVGKGGGLSLRLPTQVADELSEGWSN